MINCRQEILIKMNCSGSACVGFSKRLFFFLFLFLKVAGPSQVLITEDVRAKLSIFMRIMASVVTSLLIHHVVFLRRCVSRCRVVKWSFCDTLGSLSYLLDNNFKLFLKKKMEINTMSVLKKSLYGWSLESQAVFSRKQLICMPYWEPGAREYPEFQSTPQLGEAETNCLPHPRSLITRAAFSSCTCTFMLNSGTSSCHLMWWIQKHVIATCWDLNMYIIHVLTLLKVFFSLF